MQLHGTINHVALTVSNLDEAMRFFQPFFEFFGYTVSDPGPYAGTRLCVSVNGELRTCGREKPHAACATASAAVSGVPTDPSAAVGLSWTVEATLLLRGWR
jgi:predicted enzyme related to lactoylglutathione lyase